MTERNTRIRGTQIQPDTVEPSDLKATNSPSNTLVPSYDNVTGQFTWIAAGGGQVASTVPTEDSGISVQDALNSLEANNHAASGQFNQAVAAEISGLTAKTTPVDADVTLIEDSATSPTAFLKKKLTWAQIKATLKTYFDGLYQAVGTYLSNLVEDTTPQLGGDLDLNGKNIDFPTTANISDCLDEDNMASDSATKLATQQSIKAYADTKTTLAAAQAVLVKNDGSVNPTNLLSNGDFEAWSAGASAAPDGWILAGAGASVAREATIIKLGAYSAKLTRAGANVYLANSFYSEKGLAYFKGRTITIGCWIYATVADRAAISLIEGGIQENFSSYHTGNSTWQWITYTKTISTSGSLNDLAFTLFLGTGDTSAYFDGAMCIEGESAFAFSDKPAGEGVQVNYGNTSTIVGWSSFTAKEIYVKKIGKTVFVVFYLDGTSNAATISFTLPYVAKVGGVSYIYFALGTAKNNAIYLTTPAVGTLASGGSTVNIQRDYSATAWTNSGIKQVLGQFFYDVA